MKKRNIIIIMLVLILLSVGLVGCRKSTTFNFVVDGKNCGSNEVSHLNNVFSDPLPKDGYAFDGWFLDNDKWENQVGNTIESLSVFETGKEYTVYAKFTIIEYSITYHLDSGINSGLNVDKYTIDDNITLYQPTKLGYTFDGWYADEDFDVQIISIEQGTIGNIDLYANWISENE